jgi:hypothetical protein
MPEQRDPVYLLMQSAKCRRLADAISDNKASIALLALATELEQEAKESSEPEKAA